MLYLGALVIGVGVPVIPISRIDEQVQFRKPAQDVRGRRPYLLVGRLISVGTPEVGVRNHEPPEYFFAHHAVYSKPLCSGVP